MKLFHSQIQNKNRFRPSIGIFVLFIFPFSKPLIELIIRHPPLDRRNNCKKKQIFSLEFNITKQKQILNPIQTNSKRIRIPEWILRIKNTLDPQFTNTHISIQQSFDLTPLNSPFGATIVPIQFKSILIQPKHISKTNEMKYTIAKPIRPKQIQMIQKITNQLHLPITPNQFHANIPRLQHFCSMIKLFQNKILREKTININWKYQIQNE